MSYSDSLSASWSHRSREAESSRYASSSRQGVYRAPLEESGSLSTTWLNKTLSKLIDRFDINSTDPQRKKENLLDEYSTLILSERVPSIVENESDVVNTIRKRLHQRDSRNSEKMYRFGHLYNKLASQQALTKKWSTLYFLLLISDLPYDPLGDLSTMDTSPISSPGLQHIDQNTYLQPPVSRPYDMQYDAPRNTRRRLARESPSVSSHSESIDPPGIQLARARESRKHQYQPLSQPPISESMLLRDLIFVFQGIDGQYIKSDSTTNGYTVLDVGLSAPTKELVYKLSEIGWLYNQVRGYINKNIDTPSIGLVAQSFCAALQHELVGYYKFISILEAQIEKQMSSTAANGLSLKKMFLWTLETQQKLKLMSVLVDACQGEKGGALISIMHNYTKHGDPFINCYIIEMLQNVSKPLYEMLQRWIYEGELDDPYGEFFVACNNAASEEELWQTKYSIREDMLPSFLSKEMAQKIFSIGKSLNFIRYSCHDDTLVERYYQPSSNTPPIFQYGDDQAVERSIDSIYLETSKLLLDLLKTKYKLMDHLRALKRYLLLGQGDFIQSLMDILRPNLNKAANTLFRHNLTGILEASVRSSNAQYDDPDILNRLDVRIMEIQNNDSGWEVFSLDYHVDPPISTIFNSSAMTQYLQVFHFLWKIKRVEHTLSAAWRQWGTASRQFSQLKELSQDLHLAQLSIQRMIHFIYQLQHYVLFEVLECSWDELETNIKKSIDLDSIIEAHAKYLSEITEKAFLSGQKQKALHHRVQSLFGCILKYNTILDHLHGYASIEEARRLGNHRTLDTDKLQNIRKRQKETEDDFTSKILQFLEILKSFHDEDLRSLSTRLDYNGYYSEYKK